LPAENFRRTLGIHASYEQGVGALESQTSVAVVGTGLLGEGAYQARGPLFRTDVQCFLADRALRHKALGLSAILVVARDMAEVIAELDGKLTATLMFDPEDEPLAATLIPAIPRKVGRILANGWPTGVEASPAIVHGGQFPATSDVGRHRSARWRPRDSCIRSAARTSWIR
jgi:2,5-dioxopentanoate dehydrogenase